MRFYQDCKGWTGRAGREALSLPWKEIISRIPGAIDALSSPRRDLLVVMTPSELQIFRTHGSEVGEPLRKFTLCVDSDDPNEGACADTISASD